MSEEARKLWDLVKSKLNVDGLRDIARYYPVLRDEIKMMIEQIENLDEDD